MKLLVSAYACEPGKGSEPAVGWNWVQALLKRGYEVHVLTRSNNREAIEADETSRVAALTFHYYDLPLWAQRLKRGPGGIYWYYLFWQRGAFKVAKKIHATQHFDRVHHVTFASWRQPSFMGGLGIPFIFGPVGGGETTPACLRHDLPVRGRISEAIRNFGNSLIGFDPLMRRTFSQASVIACTTKETRARIPQRYRSKCVVQLAIGISEEEIAAPLSQDVLLPHFLFVGRLLYWKGLHLALRALGRARQTLPEIRLKVIGTGEDRDWLMAQAQQARVTDCVDWVKSIPHDEIAREYRQSVAMVFPSLHDSGGMVVLEALAAGLPVICLSCGGPGVIASSDCAVAVPAEQDSEGRILDALAQAMIRMATDQAFRARLSANGPSRAQQLTWDRAADHIYSAFPP